MTSATTVTPAPGLEEDDRERLDAAIGDLEAGTRTWAALSVGQRATLLRAVRTAVAASAEEWAQHRRSLEGAERQPSAARRGMALGSVQRARRARCLRRDALAAATPDAIRSRASASIGLPAAARACTRSRSTAPTRRC